MPSLEFKRTAVHENDCGAPDGALRSAPGNLLGLLVGWPRGFLIARLCLSFQLTPLFLLLLLLLLQGLSVLLRQLLSLLLVLLLQLLSTLLRQLLSLLLALLLLELLSPRLVRLLPCLLLLLFLSTLLRQLLSLLLALLLFQLLAPRLLRLLPCLLLLLILSTLLRQLLSLLLALLLLLILSTLLRQLLSLLLLELLPPRLVRLLPSLLLFLSALLGQLLSLLLALLLFELLSPCLVRLSLCQLRVVALLLLLHTLPFRRLLGKQLLLLLQMLTLESGIGSARRRRAGDLRQLLRVDRSGRRPGTLAGRARRACGLHPSRWRGHGSFRRMDHGRHGRRRQFHGGGDRRPTRRYASDCADAQRSSAVRLDGFLPALERRRRRGRHHAGNYRPGLYDRRRSCRGHSASAEERLLRGNHRRRHRPDGRAHDRALIDMHGVSRNRLRGGERLGRGRGHGAGYAAIDVVYVRYIDGLVVDDGGVVDIVDDRDVHCGVRD